MAWDGAATVVTGLGLVTPVGADEHTFWAGLCAGAGVARRCDELAGLPVDFACRADGADLDEAVGGRAVWRMARFVKMALVAARRAVADAGLRPECWDGGRVGVVLGVGVGGVSVLVDNVRRMDANGPLAVSPLLVPMMMPNAAAGEVAIDLRAHGPSLAPATACASGATAIALARDLLTSGQCDVVVAGGAESVLTPLVVTAFAGMGALSVRTGDPAAASRPFAATATGSSWARARPCSYWSGPGTSGTVAGGRGRCSPVRAPPRTPTTPPRPTRAAGAPSGRSRRHWAGRGGPPATWTTSTRTEPPPC